MDLSQMNRDELRTLAKQEQIPGRGSMNKAQLLEALTLHYNQENTQEEHTPIPSEAQHTMIQTGPNPLSNRTRKLNRLKRRANNLPNNNTDLRCDWLY